MELRDLAHRVLRGWRRSGLVAAWMAAGLCFGAASQAGTASPDIADERLEASYNAGEDFIRYPALDAYLKLVVQRLQDANPDAAALPIRIHALSSALPYAFLLDNGALYVSSGLIARLDSEQEFAAAIALPYAAVIRHDRQSLSTAARNHEMQNLLPNLLLITVTAGFGAPAMAKADARKHAGERAQAQGASDAVALGWLAAAGYDPKAAALALRHLRDRLLLEKRSGGGELSDPDRLSTRADALDAAAATIEAKPAATPIDPAGTFRKMSTYYALRQVSADLDDHPASVVPALDRLEAAQGESGQSAVLRAELLRRNNTGDAALPDVIAAYERALTHADVPAYAYREVGRLYRRAGDDERARRNFTSYIAKAPTASDAPIIRTFLETP